MRLEKIEDGIVRFYEAFQLGPQRAEAIRAGVLDELAADREQATRESERARLRISRLQDQRKKLLSAHYAGAVPVDMLKEEMDRLTGEIAAAEVSAKAAVRSVADLEGTLNKALAIASNCAREYLAPDATPALRRMFNQGLFRALYIDPDGEVERFEMTEPFATLLDRNLLRDLAEEDKAGRQVSVATPSQTQQREAERRSGPTAVLANSFVCPSKTDKPGGGAVRLGLHMIDLVRERGLEPPRTNVH